MKKEAAALIMRVLVEMIDPIRVEKGRAAFDSMDFVSLGEKQLGKIGSILPRDSGD
jgi:hypothetical protein